MNMEKYANGKLFSAFEWIYRLIIWNMLTILIVILFAGLPFYGFYIVQNNNLVKDVVIEESTLTITQNNDRITVLENIYDTKNYQYKGHSISLLDGDKYQLTVAFDNDIIIEYVVDKQYKEIKVVEGMIYGTTTEEEEVLIDEIYDLSYEEYKIDRNRYLMFSFKEGNKIIRFGDVIETQNTLAGMLFVISVVIAVIVFIPCFVTIFSMIKIFGEESGRGVLVLFFDRLWDNVKSLYILEIIVLPIMFLFIYATYFYYVNIIAANSLGEQISFIYVLGYNFLLVTLIILLFCLLNLPMTLGYFRMRTKSIMRFTFAMTFKNILYSFVYFFSFLIPILLCLMNSLFIPIWFVCGISVPLYVCYLVSRTKYRFLAKNIEEINSELKENTDIYKFDDNEKGEEK